MRTEDGYIIQQCLDGNSAAFGLLVDKYKRGIYALAYSQVSNFHDAQDIAQEAFIKAYQNLHTLRRWDTFMGWLYRITMNVCRNWKRSSVRRPDSEFSEDQDPIQIDNISLESYRQDLIYDSIREELDSLPELYKRVLMLRYYGGLTIKEMSTFLGISTATVERQIREAHGRLKEEILTMMETMKEQYNLPSAFTFNVLEIVKNIRINPYPPIKALPLGLSLATGFILLIFGIGSNIFLPNLQAIQKSHMSQSEMPMSYIKNMQIAFSDIPKSSYDFIGGGDKGNGSSGQQNNALMAPKGEGGKIPENPSVQLGKGELFDIKYSPDGKIFAAVTSLGIRLYDVNNLNEIGILQKDGLYQIAFSPDGKILASGGKGGSIHLWSIQERKEIGILKGHTDFIASVNFSPDGKMLVSSSFDKSIRLWDLNTQKQMSLLRLDIDYTSYVEFSPDGKLLASKGWIGEKAILQLWTINEQGNLELIHRLDGVYLFEFNPDGKTLVLRMQDDDKLLRVWDIETKKQIGEIKGGIENIGSIVFSPDGKLLAFGDYKGNIYLWDMPNQKQIGTLKEHKKGIDSLSFSPNGKALASMSYIEQKILFWDTQERKQIDIIEGFTGSYSVTFSPNGKVLTSGGTKVIFWNVADQKKIGECIPIDYVLEKLTFSPDGKILAGYSYDTIYLIDANEYKLIDSLKGHTDGIRSLAFSPDGKLLASGSFDMTLRLWDVQKQKEIWKQNCPSHTHAVVFTPDGNSVIAGIGGNGPIIVYDVKTKKETDILQTPGYVVNLAISPDGKLLASQVGSNIIIFWDFIKKRQLGSVVLGNNVWIDSLMFSPDGKWLASVTEGGECYIYDANTREELAKLKGYISNVSFSPDGKWLATTGGTINLWEVNITVESKAVNPMGKATGTWGKIKTTDLFQNYPNPFNPETWIPFSLSETQNVKIKIYNLKGELVRTLNLGHKQPGQYTTREKSAYWDGRNENGEVVASNTYFYVMEAGDYTEIKKMVLMR